MGIDTAPANPSFLSPTGFQLQIKKTPHVNYFIQKANLPSVSLATADVDTPFTKIPFPGTRLTFGNFQVTFKVDEDMKNYLEIFDWLKGIGFPDNFDQYKSLAGHSMTTGDGLFSDISLIVLSGAKNPNIQINFYDCFPVDLSEIQFESTDADINYITATATFANRRFEVAALT